MLSVKWVRSTCVLDCSFFLSGSKNFVYETGACDGDGDSDGASDYENTGLQADVANPRFEREGKQSVADTDCATCTHDTVDAADARVAEAKRETGEAREARESGKETVYRY